MFYYVDDDDKPFMVKLPIPLEQVTLGDFKRAVNRHNYKFFFRSEDPEVGEFKEEVSDDALTVPSFQGRIVVNMVAYVDREADVVRNESIAKDSASTRRLRTSTSSVPKRESGGFARSVKMQATTFKNGGRTRGDVYAVS